MAKKRKPKKHAGADIHEPEAPPDIPLPEPGDKVKLADHENSPTMIVEGCYGPNKADVRCRWFDGNGLFHEREFNAHDLVSAEPETDGQGFYLAGEEPKPKEAEEPAAEASKETGPIKASGTSGTAGAEALSGSGKEAAKATHAAETTPHGGTHPKTPHGK